MGSKQENVGKNGVAVICLCRPVSLSLGMVGCGRAHIAEVADMARANIADNIPSEALRCFASLGAGGARCSNQERDLHRWVKSLYGCGLEPYCVPMELNVSYPYPSESFNFHLLSRNGCVDVANGMSVLWSTTSKILRFQASERLCKSKCQCYYLMKSFMNCTKQGACRQGCLAKLGL